MFVWQFHKGTSPLPCHFQTQEMFVFSTSRLSSLMQGENLKLERSRESQERKQTETGPYTEN